MPEPTLSCCTAWAKALLIKPKMTIARNRVCLRHCWQRYMVQLLRECIPGSIPDRNDGLIRPVMKCRPLSRRSAATAGRLWAASVNRLVDNRVEGNSGPAAFEGDREL